MFSFQVGVLVSPDAMVVDSTVDHEDATALTDTGLGLGRELVVDISAFYGYETHEITSRERGDSNRRGSLPKPRFGTMPML